MFTQSRYSLRKRMNKNASSQVNMDTNVGIEFESTIQNDQSKVHIKLEESEELFSATSYQFENLSIPIKKEQGDESTFMNTIQGTPECLVENEFSEETSLERNKTYSDLQDDNSSHSSNVRIRTRKRRPVVIPASLDDSLPYNQFESDSEPDEELFQVSNYDFIRNNNNQDDNTLLSASIDYDSSNMNESEFEDSDTTDDTLVVKESYRVKNIVGVRTRSQTKKHQLLMNRDNVDTEERKKFSEQDENIQRNIPSKRKQYDSALDDGKQSIDNNIPIVCSNF
ncbi:hypothetical protein INT45_004421 [Circinella minor]|uniref:Uncharacterized protein n=1 Tax=Circinella minor TaxID=1195481 RepID=A0A8H7VDK9_9FUNG|nr:hypothetical protein INT45_004421 [Circinella minor]